MKRWLVDLKAPVDTTTLALFRIVFGMCMLYDMWMHVHLDLIRSYLVRPQFHWKYWGFGWVQPLSEPLMIGIGIALMIASVAITVGIFYRLSMTLFFLGFTYFHLIDALLYRNHYYLICILSAVLVVLPAANSLSIDAWRRNLQPQTPLWAIGLMRVQMFVVYFYGGVAKWNSDWLAGEPMRGALQGEYGEKFGKFNGENLVYVLVYGGLVFDLAVGFLLLIPKTRIVGAVVAVGFHLINAYQFEIGNFPWLMIGATILFFAPDWPRSWMSIPKRMRVEKAKRPSAKRSEVAAEDADAERGWIWSDAALCLGVVYVIVQLLLPLRPFFYPKPIAWYEDAYRYAWRMMTHVKDARLRYRIYLPDQDRYLPLEQGQHLSSVQRGTLGKYPQAVVAYAHFLANQPEQKFFDHFEIHAEYEASLNYRPFRTVIAPTVNLLSIEDSLWKRSEWIVPLTTPLHPSRFNREEEK